MPTWIEASQPPEPDLEQCEGCGRFGLDRTYIDGKCSRCRNSEPRG